MIISVPLRQRPPTGRRAGRSALSEELAGAGNVSTQAPPPSQAAGFAAAATVLGDGEARRPKITQEAVRLNGEVRHGDPDEQ